MLPRAYLPVLLRGGPTGPMKACDAFGKTYSIGYHVSPDGDIGPLANEVFECHWAYFLSFHWKVDPNKLSTFSWPIANKCNESWVRFAPSAEDPDRFRAYPKGYRLIAFAIGDGSKWIAAWDKDLPVDPQKFGGYVVIRASDSCW